MADSFEIAYLYARVCGAFSSMYLGAKGAALAAESSLSSIWKLYFGEEIPNQPEPQLLATLEREVIRHSMERFMNLAGSAMESDEFIAAIVAKYEISVVKNLLYRLTASEPRPESQFFSSPTIEKALSAWPRLEDMFAGSPTHGSKPPISPISEPSRTGWTSSITSSCGPRFRRFRGTGAAIFPPSC